MFRLPLILVAVLAPAAPLVAAPSSNAVIVEICDGSVSKDNSWPTHPVATEKYTEDAFGFFELPQKYVGTGVRGDRSFPTFVRATASVVLPAGKHRVLLRSRGQARVTIGGTVVLETPFGQLLEYPLSSLSLVPLEEQERRFALGPECRAAPPGNRDAVGEIVFTGQPTKVVLETLIGGIEPKSKLPFRPELGETVVAVALEGTNDWRLLSPGVEGICYTDAGWNAYEAERRQRLDAINRAARAARRAEKSDYWSQRRAAAASYRRDTPDVPVPALPAGFPAYNAIDYFIADRIHRLTESGKLASGPNTVDFYRDVRPILEAKCYDCHQGDKAKAGLRLDSLASALKGGEGDGPGIVPYKPSKSSMIERITSVDPDEIMPAKGGPLSAKEIEVLKRWIEEGADWPEFAAAGRQITPLAEDLVFLRRVYMDTIGIPPSEDEVRAFLDERAVDRRTRLIDRLLADNRWADNQMGYWLDILAENPNLINATLNNTGPFRWWLYESMEDNKPLDLLVTELIRMEGSKQFGGPAGFGLASENDAPLAAKAVIISSAFLGVEMKCARCHDSPTRSSKQKDVFELAAMLNRTPVVLPATSSVSLDHLQHGGRKPLIEVTLKPGSSVDPAWPFERFVAGKEAAGLAERPNDPRDRLAALITAPQNERFAEVMVNRIWQRLMGRGLVPEVGDWEKSSPSHPELLRWLARELVRSGYDQKAIMRLILSSHAYQRAVDSSLTEPSPLFAAPAIRRIQGEQLVDSLFAVTGKPFALEPVSLDIDGSRTVGLALDLGRARRAWMLASLSTERDRPSLILPRIQAVDEVLEAFGWSAERAVAGSGIREVEPNALQPGLLANGTMMIWLTRLSEDHGLTDLALHEQSIEALVDRLFLRILTRYPSAEEKEAYVSFLREGYATRRTGAEIGAKPSVVRQKFVSWSNHAIPEANTLRLEDTAAVRRGDPPTTRLEARWRSRLEDVIWALLNTPEWVRLM